jgi:hypothetical protein
VEAHPGPPGMASQKDYQKPGAFEFTGSLRFLTLTIIIMSGWYHSNKSFDRTLLLKTLNLIMFYQITAAIWWKIDRELSFGLF